MIQSYRSDDSNDNIEDDSADFGPDMKIVKCLNCLWHVS